MHKETVKVETGKDYAQYLIPDHDIPSADIIFDHFIVSNLQWPLWNNDGFSVPATNMHIIGIGITGKIENPEYHTSNYRWQKIRHFDAAKKFGIGEAGDNAVGWRWKEGNVINAASSVVVHLDPAKFALIGLETFDIDSSRIEIQHKFNANDPLAYALAIAINRAFEANNEMSAMYIQESLNMLTAHVLMEHCVVKPMLIHDQGTLSQPLVNKVIEYINTYFAQSISIDELAKLCNMSTFHFLRLFKRSTGLSPKQYVLLIRVRQAKKLLKKTDLLIEQIAYTVGYRNANNFSRMFTQQTGVSPTEYRKAVKH